jgi:hypothetical protein
MRATVVKVMTVVLIAAAAPMAQAQDFAHVRLVESWYERYLGRGADAGGLNNFVQSLCQGNSIPAVEANVLASTEYYDRNGCNDPAFIAALYRDVLGVAPTPQQIHNDVHQLQRMGNRTAFTYEFLVTRRPVATPPAAPVVQAYRPAYVAVAPVVRPVVVPAPVYRPAYGVRPVAYGPAPGVTIGVRQPNFGLGIAIR